MKFGIRVPSFKKRVSAKLSWKRYVRHNLGFKAPRGMGLLTNPKKKLYNTIYNRTSISIDKLFGLGGSKKSKPDTLGPNQKGPSMNNEVLSTGNIIRSSSKAITVTSSNFKDLRGQIIETREQRSKLSKNLRVAKLKLLSLSVARFTIGFFYKAVISSRETQQSLVQDLEEQLTHAYVNLTFTDNPQLEKSWMNCLDAFIELLKSEKIWDVTYAESVDRAKARTVAVAATKRTLIPKVKRQIEFIKSDLMPLTLPNANGPDLFFFPTFLILFKGEDEFGIFDIKEVNISMKLTGYIEEEAVPGDTEVIDYTWKKSNKDGSGDKRFKGNYQIPIVKYGEISLSSGNGLEESFMFSNFDAFSNFAKTYEHHISLLNKI